MSDDPENLTLLYLRRLDAKVDQMIDILKDHARRLTSLEVSAAESYAAMARFYANSSLRLDSHELRLERIERRFDLNDS